MWFLEFFFWLWRSRPVRSWWRQTSAFRWRLVGLLLLPISPGQRPRAPGFVWQVKRALWGIAFNFIWDRVTLWHEMWWGHPLCRYEADVRRYLRNRRPWGW